MNATKNSNGHSSDSDILAGIRKEFEEANVWAKAEGYGVKAIKHAAFLSEETNAFRCTVTKNGKTIGEAYNEGHGGPTCLELNRDVKVSPKEYGMIEMFVDSEIENDLSRKNTEKSVKSMQKKGFDWVLVYKENVVGGCGSKEDEIAKNKKEYGDPIEIHDFSATSKAVREAKAEAKNLKWKNSVIAKYSAMGLKFVVFYKKEKTMNAFASHSEEQVKMRIAKDKIENAEIVKL